MIDYTDPEQVYAYLRMLNIPLTFEMSKLFVYETYEGFEIVDIEEDTCVCGAQPLWIIATETHYAPFCKKCLNEFFEHFVDSYLYGCDCDGKWPSR